MTATVIRYVPTHVGKDGLRTLMTAAQGRHTYATPDEAQAWIDAVWGANTERELATLFGPRDTWQVRPVECWPGHHDPKGIYFDDAEG